MRKGHRRTESDTSYSTAPRNNTSQFTLLLKQNKQISIFLQKSNRANRHKTVCVESLELPRARSLHGHLFFFGQKNIESRTGLSTQYSEDLLSPILEKSRRNIYSINKNASKQKQNDPKLSKDCTKSSKTNLKNFLNNHCKNQSPMSHSKKSSRVEHQLTQKKYSKNTKNTKQSKLVKSRLKKNQINNKFNS